MAHDSTVTSIALEQRNRINANAARQDGEALCLPMHDIGRIPNEICFIERENSTNLNTLDTFNELRSKFADVVSSFMNMKLDRRSIGMLVMM